MQKINLKFMEEIKSKIESILFISNKPLSFKKIARLVEESEKSTLSALENLRKEYQNRQGGITIIKHLTKYEMVTSSKNSQIVNNFLKDEISGELTRPALETLTIIAYRGPITKPELEHIRGVNCGLILRNLIIRGLVEAKNGRELKTEAGSQKKDFSDQEKYYSITLDFLKFLGIGSVEELPNYKKLSQEEIFSLPEQ